MEKPGEPRIGARHHLGKRFENGDLAAEDLQHRGAFEADIAAADDDEAPRQGKVGAEAEKMVRRDGLFRPLDREQAWGGAGAEDEVVRLIAENLACLGHHLHRVGIENRPPPFVKTDA